MSAFKALNLESDDESDVEIDNTKELQIEDALKLYQNALKLHSDGPSAFSEASKAYKELFASDIFNYPESLSELRRIEIYGASTDLEQLPEVSQHASIEPLAPGEHAPSTLPQILHLAHKNYGNFILDMIKLGLNNGTVDQSSFGWTETRDAAVAALDHFVDALDKDESDNEVWRNASSVGVLLESKRIARFCLEAILEGEDDALNDLLAFSGFDQSAAARSLSVIVQEMHDVLSFLQGPLSESKKGVLNTMLRQRLNLIHDGHDLPRDKLSTKMAHMQEEQASKVIIVEKPRSWADLANILVDINSGSHASCRQHYSVGVLQFQEQVLPEDDAKDLPDDSPTWILPSVGDVAACFPGLDHGLPTVPAPAWGDICLLEVSEAKVWPIPALPTRKRSSDAAALETPDTGRVKSKRLRARESLAEGLPKAEDLSASNKKPKKDPFEESEYNDQWCYGSADEILRRLDVQPFGDLHLGRPGRPSPNIALTQETPNSIVAAALDLYKSLVESPENLSRTVTAKTDTPESGNDFAHLVSALQTDSSLNSDTPEKPGLDGTFGLQSFFETVNDSFLTPTEVAFALVETVFQPHMDHLRPNIPGVSSSYSGHKWSEAMVSAIRKLVLSFDGYIYTAVSKILQDVRDCTSHPDRVQLPLPAQVAELTQGLLEMHMEILSFLKYTATVSRAVPVEDQLTRVNRWLQLAEDAHDLRQTNDDADDASGNALDLRHVWSVAVSIKMTDHVDQSKVLSCLQELRDIFSALYDTRIILPNNTLMPVLSIDAIDREIAKLTTSEFFAKVFESDSRDPVSIIEGLEPLLDYVHARRTDALLEDPANPHENDGPNMPSLHASQELIDFLCTCSSSVILALWQRLRIAYQNIEYTPMVALCHLRMVQVCISEIKSASFQNQPRPERQTSLLVLLRQSHESLLKVLDMTKTSTTVLECVDLACGKTLLTSLVEMLKILAYANFAQDEVRVGERSAPFERDVSKAKTYRLVTTMLNEAQLSAWIVFYLLLVELQKESFELLPPEDFDRHRMELLRSVHTSVGLRGFCDGSGRILLNLLKKELPTLRHVAGYDFEFSQVLLDLYDLNCFVNPSWEQLPHDCSRDVSLDRAAAVQAVDLLLMQVSKIKLADLHKHTLKDSFERVHMVVARKKASEGILKNREIYNTFFKSPINPIDLYRCLKGVGEINLVTLPEHLAALSDKGWYFVMGYLCLSRFRSQKRNAVTSTEDLDTTISFLTQDLEYNSAKWETWFRLGQAFDSKLDNDVTWNADKLNQDMEDIAQLQRSVIHCYRMATALATRIVDPEFESSAAVAELYADFANRMYASSRPPFNMRAFALQGATRFLSTHDLVKVDAFKPLTDYTAWKFAKALYQRAIAGNPEQWFLHYMLGKCLWKMYNAGPEQTGRPHHSLVLHAFQRAIELLPRERRDKKEPQLEPHYKIVAVVHKLMTRKSADGRPDRALTLDEACAYIRATPYGRKVNPCEDFDDWERYILDVLKQMRTADKSNWHHRMIARSARIIYGDSGQHFDYAAALAAKHELTQQLFTKTMALQVWRPELERSGRHFIYTVQYTRFFMQILEGLGEKTSMDMLAKRVRKRTGDYLAHTELWADVYAAYVRMMRRAGKIPQGQETTTFTGIEYAEFKKRQAIIEKWCHDANNKDPVLETLRDALEFKKINANLCKSGQLDDLIGDAYAFFFDTKGKELWQEHLAIEKASQDAQKTAELRNTMSMHNFISGGTLSDQAIAQSNTNAVNSGENTPVKRRMGVGRREIRQCADALLTRTHVTPAQEPEPTRREIQIVIPKPRSDSFPPAVSPQTSSDDESELSEVDEEVVNQGQSPAVRTPIFPNLVEEEEGGDEEVAEEEEEAAGEQDVEMEEDFEHEDDEEDEQNQEMADGDDDGPAEEDDQETQAYDSRRGVAMHGILGSQPTGSA